MEKEVRGEIPTVRTEPIAAEPGSTEMYEASTEGRKAVQVRIHVNGAEELTGGAGEERKKSAAGTLGSRTNHSQRNRRMR